MKSLPLGSDALTATELRDNGSPLSIIQDARDSRRLIAKQAIAEPLRSLEPDQGERLFSLEMF